MSLGATSPWRTSSPRCASGADSAVPGHARRQIEAAALWWLGSRDKAPDAFIQELEAARTQLEAEPRSGTPFPTPRHPGARRLLLQKTRYHLYYTVHDEEELVLIRALWHATRGRLPTLP